MLNEIANVSSKKSRCIIEANIKKKKVERFALAIPSGKHQQTLHKYNEICGDLRKLGYHQERYIVSRSYRGNYFDIVDMLSFPSNPFFTNYANEIDGSLRQ